MSSAAAAFRVISESDKNARTAPPPDYDYDSEALLVLDRLSKLTDADKAMVEYMDDKLNIILNLFGTMVHVHMPALGHLTDYHPPRSPAPVHKFTVLRSGLDY